MAIPDGTAHGQTRSSSADLWANQLAPQVHQRMTDFPSDYSTLPSVAFVIPNDFHNMHTGTILQGDTWLRTNLSQ